MMYRVYQRTNALGEFVKIGETENEKEYVVKNLQPNTKYEFSVAAFNGVKESERSNIVALTTGSIPVAEIAISIENMQPEVGQKTKVTVTIKPEDATDKIVFFKSSDESVATIDTKGVITARKKGKTAITATASNGKTASVEIEVFDALVQPKNLQATGVTTNSTILTWE